MAKAAKPDSRSEFHKAYMKPTAACPSGFIRQGPPSAEAAAAVRQNRFEALRSLHPRQEEKPGDGLGWTVGGQWSKAEPRCPRQRLDRRVATRRRSGAAHRLARRGAACAGRACRPVRKVRAPQRCRRERRHSDVSRSRALCRGCTVGCRAASPVRARPKYRVGPLSRNPVGRASAVKSTPEPVELTPVESTVGSY